VAGQVRTKESRGRLEAGLAYLVFEALDRIRSAAAKSAAILTANSRVIYKQNN
jgi:hypothetical protein